MSKKETYSVTIDAEVLEFIVEKMLKAFPKETGSFLQGEKVENRQNIFNVTGYYYPSAEATNSSWSWEVNDLFKAVKKAASNNHRIIRACALPPLERSLFYCNSTI